VEVFKKKEQTVRGLEPEVQRLMSRHATEIADIESDRDRRLAALERELHQRHNQQVWKNLAKQSKSFLSNCS